MPPAARVSDNHVCPMVSGIVPHVGGPILPPGMITVIIGGLPAARVTDMAVCAGGPDVIARGSIGVIIGGLCAARMGDNTAHGGVIVMGLPTVIIGETAAGGGLLAIALGINPTGSVINCGFNIDAAIARLYGTNAGATSPAGQDGSFTQIGNRHGTTINWGNSLDDAFTTVRNGGPGTTAIVGIDYGNGSSHVVVMTNHYGTPVIIEGQNWGAGNPAGVISDPAVAQTRYNPADVGIGVLPNNAPPQ